MELNKKLLQAQIEKDFYKYLDCDTPKALLKLLSNLIESNEDIDKIDMDKISLEYLKLEYLDIVLNTRDVEVIDSNTAYYHNFVKNIDIKEEKVYFKYNDDYLTMAKNSLLDEEDYSLSSFIKEYCTIVEPYEVTEIKWKRKGE